MGRCGCASSMGVYCGSPKVAAVDEKMKRFTPKACITSSRFSVLDTLLR